MPLVIGTAGTCGSDSAVDWLVEITREILADLGQSAKVAVLKSNQPAARVTEALNAGQVTPLHPAPEIDEAVLASCTNIVALAGAEQIAAALETGADIVIAGRTTDTAIIAALPLDAGLPRRRRLAWREDRRMRRALRHQPAIGRDPGRLRRSRVHGRRHWQMAPMPRRTPCRRTCFMRTPIRSSCMNRAGILT